MDYHDSGAILSDCGQYRYRLWRSWRPFDGSCCFIMLNPSTADASKDDATIRRCVGFADRWGFGRMDVVNLWPLRATDPKEIYRHPAPDGEGGGDENLLHAGLAIQQSACVVAAWGNNAGQGGAAQRLLLLAMKHKRNVYALGLTKAGLPRHPVRIPYATRRVLWREYAEQAEEGGTHE